MDQYKNLSYLKKKKKLFCLINLNNNLIIFKQQNISFEFYTFDKRNKKKIETFCVEFIISRNGSVDPDPIQIYTDPQH